MKLLDYLGLAPVSGKNDYLRTFNCEVYKDAVNVCITNDINMVIKKQLKLFDISEIQWDDYLVDKNSTAVVFTIDGIKLDALYLVLRNDSTVNELIHECVHLAEKILWERDILHSPATSEVWAYFIQYLFDKVIEIFKIDG